MHVAVYIQGCCASPLLRGRLSSTAHVRMHILCVCEATHAHVGVVYVCVYMHAHILCVCVRIYVAACVHGCWSSSLLCDGLLFMHVCVMHVHACMRGILQTVWLVYLLG